MLVSARRFQELKAAPDHKDIETVTPVEHSTRGLTVPEVEDDIADQASEEGTVGADGD